jgi:hypothetical protein
MMNTTLDPRLQKLIDLGESGTDILHGELKNLMYDTEQRLANADGADPVYPYLEGMLNAFVEVYALTYQLAFAISDRTKANG